MTETAHQEKDTLFSLPSSVTEDVPAMHSAAAIATRGYIFGGFAVILLLLLGFGAWSAYTNIAGAVLAHGTVVVDSNIKKVQHPTGGIVGEIHVRNGDRVMAGDLLVRLDDTQSRAKLKIIANQIDETEGRLARLTAERDDANEINLPKNILERGSDPRVDRIITGERVLFDRRRASLKGETEQMRERIRQLEREIDGLNAQRSAKATEIELIGEELHSLIGLEQRKLVTKAKMMSLRRQAARLKGEHAQIVAEIAKARGRIAEVEIVILQRTREFKKEVALDMRESEARLSELRERHVAAKDQLQRIDITAPDTGYVHQLAVHTVGGVVAAGESIMLIVPESDPLVLEARIAPRDRERISKGTTAKIRFAAFDLGTTPEISGTVQLISADLSEDSRTNSTYYSVRISISERDIDKLKDMKLVPGLPAEVQIRTEDRTALSYFTKPLEDQFSRAFKER
ncbi:MAG: HlyD family type I secretion periplasmic adaptor subunit [Hyphomicrobiaceae bacterium]